MNEIQRKLNEFVDAYEENKDNKKSSSGAFILNNSDRYVESKKINFTQVNNRFISSSEYNHFEKLIAIILKKYSMKKDYCWPSIETIAKEVPCGVSTVKKSIKSLTSKRVISRGKNDKYRSNMYVINRKII